MTGLLAEKILKDRQVSAKGRKGKLTIPKEIVYKSKKRHERPGRQHEDGLRRPV